MSSSSKPNFLSEAQDMSKENLYLIVGCCREVSVFKTKTKKRETPPGRRGSEHNSPWGRPGLSQRPARWEHSQAKSLAAPRQKQDTLGRRFCAATLPAPRAHTVSNQTGRRAVHCLAYSGMDYLQVIDPNVEKLNRQPGETSPFFQTGSIF